MIKAYNDQATTEPKPHGALCVYVPVDVALLGGSNHRKQPSLGFVFTELI